MLFPTAGRHKVRPASVVDPNPRSLDSPRISFRALRPAPLLHHLHATPHVQWTEIPSPVIRSAVERLRRSSLTSLTTLMLRPLVRLCHKLRPASMVHPDSALIESPRVTFGASRLAMLPDQVHIAAGVRFAVMPPAIIRRTANNRFTAPIFSRPLKLHPEVGPASVIHPDPAFVIAPRISLLASRAARLLFQRHARPRIRRAMAPPSVIRRAGNLPPAVGIAGAPHRKLRPATMVDPDSLIVVTPRPALLAWCAAHLLHHRYPVARVRLAELFVPVIGRAPHDLGLCSSRKWTQNHTQHNQHSQYSHVDLRLRLKHRPSLSAKLTARPREPQSICCPPVADFARAKFPNPAREGKCHISASYNFFHQKSWLTESFWPSFTAKFLASGFGALLSATAKLSLLRRGNSSQNQNWNPVWSPQKRRLRLRTQNNGSISLQYCLVPTNLPTSAGGTKQVSPVRKGLSYKRQSQGHPRGFTPKMSARRH